MGVLTCYAFQYAAMPAGIIRGALSRLGYVGTVVPEITSLPQCEILSQFTFISYLFIVQVHFRLSFRKEHRPVFIFGLIQWVFSFPFSGKAGFLLEI